MHWLLDPLQKHYADFEGRVGRQEFWMYVLIVFGINVVLSIVNIGILSMVIGLGLLVPNIAITTRRLHDTGRSGWLQLLLLIPLIGLIIVVIWLAQETTLADNEYGKPAQPKPQAGAPSAPVTAATTAAAPVADSSNEHPIA